MRLKSVYISEYKNLNDFNLSFDGDSFVDIFVGKNGCGKSNLLEALVVIFQHIYEQDASSATNFDFTVSYEIEGQDNQITWKEGAFFINGNTKGQKTFTTLTLPENILIYYSGHNDTITQLVRKYETSFRDRIKDANIEETRRFIGIGPEYKSLLLGTLLLQPESNLARKYVIDKLSIDSVSDEITLTLERPKFASGRLKALDANAIEQFDPRTHYWGADGVTREFLEKVISCIKGEFNHANVYDEESDQYKIPVNIGLFQKAFSEVEVTEQFRLLDNLKTLGMLTKLDVGLTLRGQPTSLEFFSDGQFQSVYIYSITELFKDRHCITLLDEPDSFLHPEWQFKFLSQVFDIAESAAQTNHVLMSSHSASTIATANESTINLFEFDNDQVVINKVKKSDVIKSLSAGLISFTEGEARLNIQHVLKNTSGPVLFTEGITDEMILEVAWNKLYPGEEQPFEVQGAFDRHFLRNLFSRDELVKNYPKRSMFALFDFDEAYDDWNGLKAKDKNVLLEADPMKGLCKQLKCECHYAVLLPVPDADSIKPQVLDANGAPWGRGIDSHLSIEILFYREEWLGQWFKKRATPGGGEIIEFSGDKVKFANDVIPSLASEAFELFVPLFELVKSKSEIQKAVA